MHLSVCITVGVGVCKGVGAGMGGCLCVIILWVVGSGMFHC